jgi:hypothetical protein
MKARWLSHGGLGLGLSIVHHLVELHGGTVQVHSAGLNQGSTFTVHLPQLAFRPSASGHNHEEPRHPTADVSTNTERDTFYVSPDLRHIRLLLVDDEADSRDVIQAVLQGCNAQISTAPSVDEAFEAFKKLRPDVLISDIGMPVQEGYSLIKKIRDWEVEDGGRVSAIAVTAYARTEDRVRALRAGFQVHVPKPVEPLELIAVVASLTKPIQSH